SAAEGPAPPVGPAPSVLLAPAVLRAERVTKEFGGLRAVDDVSVDLPEHSIVSLIGPNGAGKTTLFNMLTGLYPPTQGRIVLGARDITRSRPDEITGYGVARTFQNIRLFGAMTAVENVMIGQHVRMRAGLFGSIFRPPWVRREERETRERARELLAYVGLSQTVFDRLAAQRAHGDKRRACSRAGAGGRAERPAARRADRWDEPPRIGGAGGLHAQAARREEADHPADRARHEGRDGGLRARHRARSRQEDRRGGAGRGQDGPAG